MNDKIKELLENAEKVDGISKIKWRIENREQLRKERKEKLKELMEKDKQQTALKLYTEEQLLNTAEAIRDYLKNYPEKFHESMIKKHLMNLAPVGKKRTLIIYNTKETTEEEARHLLEILNCDDSTLWDNADHCGVQVIEVPLTYGGGEQ